jgi:hypothetical protein
MFKHIMFIVCMVVVAGCASNNAEVNPVNTKIEPPSVNSTLPQQATIAVEQPKAQIPTTLNFKRNVTFNHKFHSETFDCSKCHLDSPGKIENFGKDFAHKTCMGCHEEHAKSNSCNACHRD